MGMIHRFGVIASIGLLVFCNFGCGNETKTQPKGEIYKGVSVVEYANLMRDLSDEAFAKRQKIRKQHNFTIDDSIVLEDKAARYLDIEYKKMQGQKYPEKLKRSLERYRSWKNNPYLGGDGIATNVGTSIHEDICNGYYAGNKDAIEAHNEPLMQIYHASQYLYKAEVNKEYNVDELISILQKYDNLHSHYVLFFRVYQPQHAIRPNYNMAEYHLKKAFEAATTTEDKGMIALNLGDFYMGWGPSAKYGKNHPCKYIDSIKWYITAASFGNKDAKRSLIRHSDNQETLRLMGGERVVKQYSKDVGWEDVFEDIRKQKK